MSKASGSKSGLGLASGTRSLLKGLWLLSMLAAVGGFGSGIATAQNFTWSGIPDGKYVTPPTSIPVGSSIKYTVKSSNGSGVPVRTVVYATLISPDVIQLRGGSLKSVDFVNARYTIGPGLATTLKGETVNGREIVEDIGVLNGYDPGIVINYVSLFYKNSKGGYFTTAGFSDGLTGNVAGTFKIKRPKQKK